MPHCAIIDYGMGNIRSVQKALEKIGCQADVHELPENKPYDTLVLPGVGSFDHAMERLNSSGWDKRIQDHVKSGRPFIGMCLGLQLLFDCSEEGAARGLGVISGKVVRFSEEVRCPHMGWNTCYPSQDYWKNRFNNSGLDFYFVHSYYAQPADASIVALTTAHGVSFPSMIHQENIIATQFHPEKSQSNGLFLLKEMIHASGVSV